MSKSAGTLVTTHNATYISPRFMPGYKGHVPTMKFDYAETYGNATAKYFQDYRSKTLETSRSNYCQGGYFPTYYSHNPDIAVEHRTRNRDRWLTAPRYSLTNIDHDRKENMIHFSNLSQAHRDHYQDKSGTVHRVDYFQLPTKAEEQFKKFQPFAVMSFRHTDSINIPDRDHLAGRKPLASLHLPRPSREDRKIRDVYHETR